MIIKCAGLPDDLAEFFYGEVRLGSHEATAVPNDKLIELWNERERLRGGFPEATIQLIQDAIARLTKLELERKRLRSALEFYANVDNYNKVDGSITDMQPRGLERKLWRVLDFGDRARAALGEDTDGKA